MVLESAVMPKHSAMLSVALCLHATEVEQQCTSLCRVEINLHLGKQGHTSFEMITFVCFPIEINKQANILEIRFLLLCLDFGILLSM
jgi:hypothetical protein